MKEIFEQIVELQWTDIAESKRLFLSLTDDEKVAFRNDCNAGDAASEGIYWGYVTNVILGLSFDEEQLIEMFIKF